MDVVVSGCGIIGLMSAELARAAGARVAVTGIEQDRNVRLKLAEQRAKQAHDEAEVLLLEAGETAKTALTAQATVRFSNAPTAFGSRSTNTGSPMAAQSPSTRTSPR